MLFVLGIVKISTGPRTLHIILNTGSTASRAHSFDAQVRARFESEGWRSQVSQLPAPASELYTNTALVLVANHYINTRISVSPVCVDIRAPAFGRTRSMDGAFIISVNICILSCRNGFFKLKQEKTTSLQSI